MRGDDYSCPAAVIYRRLVAQLGVGVDGRIYWVWESQEVIVSSRGPAEVRSSSHHLAGCFNHVSLGQSRGSQEGKTSGYQRGFCGNCIEAGSTGDASCRMRQRGKVPLRNYFSFLCHSIGSTLSNFKPGQKQNKMMKAGLSSLHQ